MKVWWMLLCTITFLCSQNIQYKLITYTDKNGENAQKSLLKLKVHFIENPNLRTLSEHNRLNVELEKLGEYTMVVVKPVVSMSAKNSLMMELSPIYPDLFVLEDKQSIDNNGGFKSKKSETKGHLMNWVDTIGLQWIVLLLLAIMGLTLSLLRRKNLLALREKQKKLDNEQQEIEQKINQMGMNDV